MWPRTASRSAVNPSDQLPSVGFALMNTVHGEQMTLNGAVDARRVLSSHSRWVAPSSVLWVVSGSLGSDLNRRWSSTQTSASPAEKWQPMWLPISASHGAIPHGWRGIPVLLESFAP